MQSFIAQARKTQDLYAGSRLLSSLTRSAYDLLQTKVGKRNIELIFPAFYDAAGQPVQSNPNRFAVKISGLDAAAINKVCDEVKEEVVTIKFVDNATKNTLSILPGYLSVESKAKKQLETHLEIFWAAIPITEKNYHQKYAELESLLGGTKNIHAPP